MFICSFGAAFCTLSKPEAAAPHNSKLLPGVASAGPSHGNHTGLQIRASHHPATGRSADTQALRAAGPRAQQEAGCGVQEPRQIPPWSVTGFSPLELWKLAADPARPAECEWGRRAQPQPVGCKDAPAEESNALSPPSRAQSSPTGPPGPAQSGLGFTY